MARRLSDRQYAQLLEFRTSLRQFLKWSESHAKAAGVTPAHHQLLLAIKGHPDGNPSVGDIASYLLLRHHSAVELIDRATNAGLVERVHDPADGRVIRATLTREGEAKLDALSAQHLREIKRLSPMLRALTEPPGGPPPA